MWLIDDLEILDVELDFTSSFGGRSRTQAVHSGDTCLVNALAFTDFGDDPTQLIVCEACGIVHCQPGGWVHIRRVGDSIVFIPAFAELPAGEFESVEYLPPAYLSSRGIPLFAPEIYQQLRVQAPVFPTIENIPSITASEAVWLTQWDAPLSVLGRFPHQPKLIRNAILAVSDGQLDDECDWVQHFLDSNFDSSAPLSLIDASGVAPIEFHLDGPGFPAWRPVARVGDQLVFNIENVGQLAVIQ